jgi:hypothetical protein
MAMLAIALVACSSAKTTSTSQDSADATSGADDSPNAEASAMPWGGDNAYNPSTKLTKADVQPFFTVPIEMKRETDLTGQAAGCLFSTSEDDGPRLQIVTVTGPQADSFYSGNASQDGVPGVPLAGVGEKAIREAKDVWVYAMNGGVFCMIHGERGGGTAKFVGLKKYGRSDAIPDAIAQPVATQLGTLCNKIYGSGNTTPSFSGLDN